MKNLIIVICLLFTSSAFAELTPADVQTISNIVEKAVSASEKRTREYIDTAITQSEKRTREYIDLKLEGLESRLTSKMDSVESRMDSVERNITLIVALVVGLMVLVVLAVGIPQLILISKQNNQNVMQKELEAVQAEMQQLRNELALLLQDQIVKP